MSEPPSAAESVAVRVKAFAKLNLDLRVLYRRADSFHELRTLFHTISLADDLEIEYTPSGASAVRMQGEAIPDNLVERAARACLAEWDDGGHVRCYLRKRIPMGAGLGGGSSDAAAMLLALPVLARRPVSMQRLLEMAAALGSDVPFFLEGGAAAGLGRGEELYPVADRPGFALVIAPGIHVSTPAAYGALAGLLNEQSWPEKVGRFQEFLRNAAAPGHNDFEAVVFAQHPKLESIKSQLCEAGAEWALMSGSGSSVFGLFRSREQVIRARERFREETTVPVTLVSRRQFRRNWWRKLAPFAMEKTWPPRSRSEL